MNAYARLAEPSSAPADLDDVTDTDPPEAAALRLLAEWFAEGEDAPPGLADRTIARCESEHER